jgi:hypothetical protein
MAFVFESQAKFGIVDKSPQSIKLFIKNPLRLILDNFGIVGFLFFGRNQWIRLTSLFILIVF